MNSKEVSLARSATRAKGLASLSLKELRQRIGAAKVLLLQNDVDGALHQLQCFDVDFPAEGGCSPLAKFELRLEEEDIASALRSYWSGR